MFGLSTGHLIILVVVFLLLFGAKRLPELGGSLGKGIKNFKKGLEGKDVAELEEKNKNKDHDKDHS